MKKANILLMMSLSFSALSMSIIPNGTVVFADETEAVAGFKLNEEVPPIVDPENPSNPENPSDPVKPDNNDTGNVGPLSLDVVPTKMDFGLNTVKLTRETYQSALPVGTRHVLQITDNRDSLNGWEVRASRTEFIQGDNEKNPGAALNGSVLQFPEGVARNAMNSDPTQPDSRLISGSQSGVHTIPVGSEVAVLTAPNDSEIGKLSSTYVWDASKETLTVPQNTAKAGNYSSTINWTLVAASLR